MLQTDCNPKSIGWSNAKGKSVVSKTLFDRGPMNGFKTNSPMRESSPKPANKVAGMCKISDSALVCEREE
jgi:hypothetical protein